MKNPGSREKQVKALPHHTQRKLLSFMNEIVLERDPTFADTFKVQNMAMVTLLDLMTHTG
jgi:hypothetical protein